MGPTVYEVELIGSGFLAVMAKPVAGEWADDEFSGLYESGIRQVVSLLNHTKPMSSDWQMNKLFVGSMD